MPVPAWARRRSAICDHCGVRDPRIVFVLSPHQNAFFAELAAAFTEALEAVRVPALMTFDAGSHEVEEFDVFVLLPPHEYLAIEGSAFLDDGLVAARTIGLSAEQPHQPFFERNATAASKLGAALDFSPLAVEAYHRLGIPAVHQPFGYVPSWDRVHGRPRGASPTVDVLYLGNKRPRRLEALAQAADALVGPDVVLRISDTTEPNVGTSPSFVSGRRKRDLLASTRLLLNIHQSDEPYFEWLRFADAAHCGVPVLSERSSGSDPFVAGEHYLEFDISEMAAGIERALAEPDRLETVAAAAYDQLRRRPLIACLEPLLTAAAGLLPAPPPTALPARCRHEPVGRDRTDPEPLASWRPGLFDRLRRRVDADRFDTIAPAGTTFRRRLELGRDELLATCIVDGADLDGRPTLEGIWPWQPWRLSHGQHLGRVMVVDPALRARVRRWIVEPWVIEHEHVAVQLFCAVHGIEGGHRPRPLATCSDRPLDPDQNLPPDVAARCRDILSGRP